MSFRLNVIIFLSLAGLICAFAGIASAAFEGLNGGAMRIDEWLNLLRKDSAGYSACISREWRFGLPELAVNRVLITANRPPWVLNTRAASTGDDIYSENTVSLAGGIAGKRGALLLDIAWNRVDIARYGSAATGGAGFVSGLRLSPGVSLYAGSHNLLRGKIRLGQDDVATTFWTALDCSIDDRARLAFIFEKERRRFPVTMTLILEGRFTDWLEIGLKVSDNPALYGIKVDIHTPAVSVLTAFENQPPLGLIKRIGIGYEW